MRQETGNGLTRVKRGVGVRQETGNGLTRVKRGVGGRQETGNGLTRVEGGVCVQAAPRHDLSRRPLVAVGDGGRRRGVAEQGRDGSTHTTRPLPLSTDGQGFSTSIIYVC